MMVVITNGGNRRSVHSKAHLVRVGRINRFWRRRRAVKARNANQAAERRVPIHNVKPNIVWGASQRLWDEPTANKRSDSHPAVVVGPLFPTERVIDAAASAAVVRGVNDEHVFPHSFCLEQRSDLAGIDVGRPKHALVGRSAWALDPPGHIIVRRVYCLPRQVQEERFHRVVRFQRCQHRLAFGCVNVTRLAYVSVEYFQWIVQRCNSTPGLITRTHICLLALCKAVVFFPYYNFFLKKKVCIVGYRKGWLSILRMSVAWNGSRRWIRLCISNAIEGSRMLHPGDTGGMRNSLLG